ncbi:FliM/FliN family flagellar motor switch protein [Pukyongiella litopenaei]|uniref:FliM/FliN family flagellar motor switch protein n=1 Tax=Pukyongiella litopenaei TaxID=2605946 RepID=A0A2S0MK69_9RHOB|nr:FliM/FliN family flagellar motor C-terminal domain-containing protein [Pukyongiella litopenaei]AVO36288.2 FliM/FliN family flagellar motor switch protein [Pukyongiella litopenaei]
MTGPDQTVLRHKLASGREDANGARPGARSALRALRLAIARAAEEVLDLRLSVIGATQWRGASDGLDGRLGGNPLLIMLDGPGGAPGAVALDPGLVTALIQHQTMGRVIGGDAPDRIFTATDAALAEPLIAAVMSRLPDLADDARDRACLTGFRPGVWVDSAESLALALDGCDCRLFEMKLDLAGGAGQGALSLVLPEADTRQGSDPAETDRADMATALGAARADLTAVLCRMRMPLDALRRLAPGDLLPLAGYRLDRTGLYGIDGQLVASGRLGQAGGVRAIRIGAPSMQDAEPVPYGPGKIGAPARHPDQPVSVPVTEVLPPDPARDEARTESGAPGTAARDDDDTLADLSPEDAMREITHLAGLPSPEPS